MQPALYAPGGKSTENPSLGILINPRGKYTYLHIHTSKNIDISFGQSPQRTVLPFDFGSSYLLKLTELCTKKDEFLSYVNYQQIQLSEILKRQEQIAYMKHKRNRNQQIKI